MTKTYFNGTHRARRPAETLELISPLFSRFGITRLGDVTGLDSLGIPVVMAVRPTAATLSVSQGKGVDLVSAQVSAAMEAIELWHAENAVPTASVAGVPAESLGLPYRLADVESSGEAIGTEATPLDWIAASGLVSGAETLVPHDLVEMNWAAHAWQPPLVVATSNGLASGNTVAESAVHALYEVIERDAASALALTPASERTYVRPESIADVLCQELIARLRAGDAWIELVMAPSRLGVPCFVCYLWSPDYIGVSTGSGAHSDPTVALARALTEAAQSRLTSIVGTRDDIRPEVFRPHMGRVDSPATKSELADWNVLVPEATPIFGTFEAEMAYLAQKTEEVSGMEPLLVDLSTSDMFAVTKVLCPGMTFLTRHEIPRGAEGGDAA
ncbi:YcaO-like family protein [Streptomyces sp. NPDC002403]